MAATHTSVGDSTYDDTTIEPLPGGKVAVVATYREMAATLNAQNAVLSGATA